MSEGEGSPFPPFPWKTLSRALDDAERAALSRTVRALLRFQRTLQRFPRLSGAPDATPFVSLYAGGSLRGCYGSEEGGPAERLTRAFLRAQGDDRFGGVSAAQRQSLVAQVSYPRNPRLVNPSTAADEIEPGTHGVALVRDAAHPVLLLPHVARDERIRAGDLLTGLTRKAGLPPDALTTGALYLFETEDIVVRDDADPPRADRSPETLAAGWLASCVAPDGHVDFAVDPRARRRIAAGMMHHGRAAVVVQALAAAGGHDEAVARARRRLESDVRAALRGEAIVAWPDDRAAVAGTLALAVLAGAQVRDALASFAASFAPEIARVPWHAAQVVTALGREAPGALWTACAADLEGRPWAPWTSLAAGALGDRAVQARTARALADALREDPPHRGGVSFTPIPEIALTAISIEALARHRASWAREAVKRGRAFLAAVQLTGDRIYGALDPDLARGAFPMTPIADQLRGDVTGHALLALLA